MKTCIYCGKDKPDDEFSDEHIWPDALGGDYLPPDLWRTDDVCINCNSMSGVFVDGSFIKSWLGANERAHGAQEYLAPTRPGPLPLVYTGKIAGAPVDADEVAEYWIGPCGANIIHVRPDDKEEHWRSYAGGDPRSKKSTAGHAYIALTTTEPYWIRASLLSFVAHFKNAAKYVTNMQLGSSWTNLKEADPNDSLQAKGLAVAEFIRQKSLNDEWMLAQSKVDPGVGTRMLAKLALSIGYKLFGPGFLATTYGLDLRRGFREGNSEKRRLIPIKGSGFLSSAVSPAINGLLAWPGGWLLMLLHFDSKLLLSVVSPSGQSMQVLITDDPALLATLGSTYKDGKVWLIVPPAKRAVGPLPLREYLGHQTMSVAVQALSDIEALRTDPAKLPPCSTPDESP
jgi:hypothetical protein